MNALFLFGIRTTHRYVFIAGCWRECVCRVRQPPLCNKDLTTDRDLLRAVSTLCFTWAPRFHFCIWRCNTMTSEIVSIQASIIGNKTFLFRMNGHSLALWYTNVNHNLPFICSGHTSHSGSPFYRCHKTETNAFRHLPLQRSILRTHPEIPSWFCQRTSHLAPSELRFGIWFLLASLFWSLTSILTLIQAAPTNLAEPQQNLRMRWADLSIRIWPVPLLGECAHQGEGLPS